jgi:hypothetical protein
MQDDTTFSALRSLLQQPPSEDIWYAIVDLLDVIVAPADELLDYVRAHLARWSSHIARDADDDAFDWFEEARPSWSLGAINSIGIGDMTHLIKLPHASFASQIVHLRLGLNELPLPRQLGAILRKLPALESITLSKFFLPSGYASPDLLIKALCEHWPARLTHLTLNRFTSNRGLRLLAARLGKLRSLTIELDVQTAPVLLSAAGLAQLHTLELRCCEDGDKIVALLLQAESLEQLTSLTIINGVGEKLLDLLRAPQLQQLKYLDPSIGALSPAVAHQIVTMPWPAALSQ